MLYRNHHPLWLVLLAGCLLATALPCQADVLQDTVNAGNRYANSQQYPQAIEYYEKAVKLAPNETKLKENLGILYFNHAAQLQEAGQYDAADTYFHKALQLSPNDVMARRGLSANQYYRIKAQVDGGALDFAAVEKLLTEAMASDPEESAYRRMLASQYITQAHTHAEKSEYEAAATLLEKAHALEPGETSIKKSLANVYLGVASTYGGDHETQKQWVEKAKAMDDSEAVAQKGQRLLSGKAVYGDQVEAGGATAPEGTAGWSIADKLAAIEKTVGESPNPNTPMISRLETAEKKVFGKKKEGSIDERTDRMFAALFGNGQTVKDSLPNLIQQRFTETSKNTYIDKVFEYTGGQVARWARFPVRIYIEAPKDDPRFRPEFEEAVKQGIEQWKTASGGFVTYSFVKNRLSSDIEVVWADGTPMRYSDPRSIADNPIKNYEPPKDSKLAKVVGMAAAFTPGVYGLAPQAANAALQYREYHKIQVLSEESQMVIGLDTVRDLPLPQATTLLQNLSAQAFGHALGIKGCSDDPKDLMHPAMSTQQVDTLSERDLATLRELYSRPANIVLNVR